MLGVRVGCHVMARMHRANRGLADRLVKTRSIQRRVNLPKRTLSTTSVMCEEEKSDNLPKPDSGENEPKRDAVGQPAGPSRDPYRDAPTDPYGDPYRDAYERGMMEGRMRSSDPYYGESHYRYRMYDPYYRRDVERDLYHLDRRQYDPYYRDRNRDLYYTRERDVYPGRERDLYPGRDRYLYPGRDRDFYSGRERDLYPRRESDPYPGRERNLYPARESYNYPGRERDLYPAGKRDSSSSRNEFHDRAMKSESADNSITVKIPKPSEEKREKQQSNRTQSPNKISPQGEFLPEHLVVSKAIKAGKRDIHKIYLTEKRGLSDGKRQLLLSILMTAEERNIPVQYVSHKQLSQMSQIHNGILADVSKLQLKEYKFEETDNLSSGGKPELWLAVSSVISPATLGSLIRSAYCLGAKTIITYDCPSFITPHASSSATGTPEVADVYKTSNLKEFLQEAKDRGKHIIAHTVGKAVTVKDAEGASMTLEATPLSDVTLSKDSILFFDFNNFKLGISDTKRDMLSLCDELVTIPRYQGDDNDMLAPIDTLSILQYHLISSAQKGH